MKHIIALTVMFACLSASLTTHANDEQLTLNETLFKSVVNQDFGTFKESLELGANPDAMTDGQYYTSSALCESTKPGNEIYLDAIIDSILYMEFIYNDVLTSSQATCAVAYRNDKALNKIIALGLDVGRILNPQAPYEIHRTLLDLALNTGSMDLVWIIMQHAEPTEIQVARLVRTVERTGGIEGHRYVPAIKNVVSWLQKKGVKVNPKPPTPVNTDQ